jgi:hypothetical protein
VEKVASLAEIRSEWTIEDVADANDMLDFWAAMREPPPTTPAPKMEPAVAAMLGRRR